MKRETKNKLQNVLVKNWLKILLVLIAIVIGYYFFFYSSNPVKSELSQLQEIAQKYKTENGHFGIIGKVGDERECFSGNTFVKSPEATEVLTSPDVENISCVFKTATGSLSVESWSVTIVKGEKAYCEDSTGVRMETPGLTIKETCIAE